MVDELSKTPISILVVEDESLIRMMVADTLSDAGFSVSEAESGQAAMHVLEKSGDEIHAIILDVGLPDLSGEKLVEMIRAQKPHIPIIVTTGYDITNLGRKFAGDPLTAILAKPYQLEKLDSMLGVWGIRAKR